MASIAQALPESGGQFTWLRQWLKDELSPYSGRALLVARMVAAATLVMILTMTFRLPYGAYSALLALNLSRESLEVSRRAVLISAAGFALAGAYALLSSMAVSGDPMVRFVWVVGTLFLIFYGVSVSGHYPLSIRFGYLVIITIPLWDQHIPTSDKVTGTLWAVGTLTLANAISLLLEIAYAALRRGNDLMDPLTERLACVEEVLWIYADNRPVDANTQSAITRFAMLGTSRLRRLLQSSRLGPQYAQEMGAVVALVGRLVDMAANLPQFVEELSDDDRKRIGEVASRIAEIRRDLGNGRVPAVSKAKDETEAWQQVPLFGEIERTVSLIPELFSGAHALGIFQPAAKDAGKGLTLTRETLLNPEHLKYALKGCLAASLCYITYNALFWPGISTAVTTCFLTALSTVGASRQKQALRFSGAFLGGLVIGMGAQIFILPSIDSISGFTLLFILVATVGAWIATSSPRLSYFGEQVALAYFLINLQEFRIQTSLGVARDRVVGILLGLSMMWLVFDRLWSAPAAVEMKRTFVANLRILAQFAREPISKDLRTAIERSYSLRETIDTEFDKVRSLADGILFEFGPSRPAHLELRNCVRQWQPQLRSLFVMRIASVKYRLRLPDFELPETVRLRQQAYDEHSARMLEEIADRIEKGAPIPSDSIEDSHKLLSSTLNAIQSEDAAQLPPGRAQSFITLLRGIDALTTSLSSQIPSEVWNIS